MHSCITNSSVLHYLTSLHDIAIVHWLPPYYKLLCYDYVTIKY